MPNKEKKPSHKNDAVLIGSLLLVGLATFFLLRWFAVGGTSVVVEVEGESAQIYSLDTPREVVLAGGGNVLVIEDGKAYVKDCTCPDKLCEKQGKISNVGESITCLPHRVHIHVAGKSDVDVTQ